MSHIVVIFPSPPNIMDIFSAVKKLSVIIANKFNAKIFRKKRCST